jgi:glycosyltransferase involved in cell wall biosynthesis
MNPLVSVIIPCYNQAKFLPDSINSVLAQTYVELECIIVNDGSPDNAREVAMEYARKDPRIRYVEQENRGLSGARNAGIEHARGNYIQFLDADDWLEHDKFEKQLAQLMAIPGLAVSYTDYICHGISGLGMYDHAPTPCLDRQDLAVYALAKDWETRCSIPPHCFLFDARLFTERGIRFDESLVTHEDWDCWMKIFALQPNILHIPYPLAFYRLHGASMCVNRYKMWRGYRDAIRIQLGVFKHDPIMRAVLKAKMCEMRAIYKQPEWLYRIKDCLQRVGMSGNRLMARFSRSLFKGYKRFMPWPIQKWFHNIHNR